MKTFENQNFDVEIIVVGVLRKVKKTRKKFSESGLQRKIRNDQDYSSVKTI